MEAPNVLILDEPTNDLDIQTLQILEDYLDHFAGIVIAVSHDRYFLDSVCNRIVEVDRGSIYSYDTNYSGFLALKAQREEYARASERKRQSILRKEIEWMQRGARARSTKQKAHIQRYEALRDQEGIKEVQKLEMSSLSTRLGRSTIEINNISKAFGDIVCVKDFTYILLKGDRIGFVGKNGCGKTTLMKMIAGLIEPDSGTIEVGQTVKIGYYCQEITMTPDAYHLTKERSRGGQTAFETAYMNPNERVIDYIKDTAEYVRTEEGLVSASAMLERFLFPAEQQYSPIGKLSGGERRRLNLLRVLMEAPNVMILDEPTNDLDTETLAILEDYLDNYDGIVVTVSHDRYFLDRIAKRIFAFEGNGKVTQYEGGYTDYMQKRPAEIDAISSVGVKSGASNPATGSVDAKQDSRETWGHQKKLKFTYKEQKEYETIESDIAALEEKIEELEDSMSKFARDFVKLNQITKEKEEAEALLEEKMDRWMYLEELKAKIDAQV
jgi:ATP-binding cassette subfamily F protein uup